MKTHRNKKNNSRKKPTNLLSGFYGIEIFKRQDFFLEIQFFC